MSARDSLIAVLGEMGIPDRIGFIGGIRTKVADILITVVKERGGAQTEEDFRRAVALAQEATQET